VDDHIREVLEGNGWQTLGNAAARVVKKVRV
jgi:hypothetical protein